MKKKKKKRKDIRADCGVAPRVHERKGAACADSRRGGGDPQGRRVDEKRGDPYRVCKREGPLCTCERRGAVSEKRKKKKEKKSNQKNKLKKGAASSACGTAHPEQDARRRCVASRPRTRQGRGGCPRARGGRCRIAENMGCDATRGRQAGWGCEKEGSSQRTTKKRKKIKKNEPGGCDIAPRVREQKGAVS